MGDEHDIRDVAVIGTGAAASAMVRAFAAAGVTVKAIAGRRKSAAESIASREGLEKCLCTAEAAEAASAARLVILAVSDGAIASVSDRIAAASGFRPGSLVAHLSGALPSSILTSARMSGARIGSMHPLLSFPRGRPPPPLAGAVFAVEGPPDSLDDLKSVVKALGAQPVEIAADSKPLYHAAAAIVSNYTVTLLSLGLSLFDSAGVPPGPGEAGLCELLAGTVRNMKESGAADALTGPVARGDVATVEEHIKALKAHAPGILPVYAALGLKTVDLALGKGMIQAAEAEILKTMFSRHT